MRKQLTAPPSTEDLARLAALSAKLRSQDPIPSRSEIAEITPTREVVDRRGGGGRGADPSRNRAAGPRHHGGMTP